MALNRQIRFVHQDKPEPGVEIAPVSVFDEADEPVDIAAGGPTSVTAAGISDATATGRAVLTAADAAAARKAIGAGVSSFNGSYNDLTGKPTIPAAYTLPAAGTALGGVKKGAAVAAVTAADAAVAAGDAPTKAEYDAAVTALNETKRQLNALIASLKASGVIG